MPSWMRLFGKPATIPAPSQAPTTALMIMATKVTDSISTIPMKRYAISITGRVCPTFMVPGISSSGTSFAWRYQAVVGAKLPMPRVSKKLVTKPISVCSADGIQWPSASNSSADLRRALEALQREGIPRARCVVLIEACEESGSFDLPPIIDHLRDRIGEPQLVVCLDSGCGNYDQLWSTTSLRGLVTATLSVEMLSEGVHSGDASGIVPSTFRILRSLLSRIEDESTGEILLEECHTEIPGERVEQAATAAEVLGDGVAGKFPFLEGAGAVCGDPVEQILARTWRPALSITGAGGLPALSDAGNVLRSGTKVALSLRLPPTVDAERAARAVKAALEADPPCGALVRVDLDEPCGGWDAPELAPWLVEVTELASQTFFGRGAVYMGEGGSIPFMGMLGEEFPAAQFLITGVLGPGSTAHGPNEFLDVPMGVKLTCCVAEVLAGHHRAHAG